MRTKDIVGLYENQIKQDQALFEQWHNVGRVLSERKMTDPEILDLFSKIETGMTNKATGANRTWMGRGKDTATDFAGGVKDAFNGIINSIQTSAPVAAVDVAYDKATDALANVTGGDKGKIMQAIKGYRNLVKEYPKTAGFAKAALVAIAGLATGGAGLPAIAGLTYALDSAIRGDKLSSVIGKGAGAAALAAAGQGIHNAISGQAGAAGAGGLDPSQFPAYDDNGNLMPGFHVNPETGQTYYDPSKAADAGVASGTSGSWDDMEHSFDYTVKSGDTLSDILHDRQINPEIARRLNPDLFGPDGNPNIIKAGQTIRLPNPEDMDIWNRIQYTGTGYDAPAYHGQYAPGNTSSLDAANNLRQQQYGRWGSDAGMSADRVARDAVGGSGGNQAQIDSWRNQDIENAVGKAWAQQPDDYGWVGGRNKVRESAIIFPRFIASTLPIEQLYDRKATIRNLKINENFDPRNVSITLTRAGVYKVFENVLRYNNYLFEASAGPDRTNLPNEYRPDMPGGAGGYDNSKKGMIGKGLDWINKQAGKVGSALGNFGHQLTTNVTKEKLKMNWHQAGKPSDSEAIAAFLEKQGVPKDVINNIYQQMGLTVTAPPAQTGQATQTSQTLQPTTSRPQTAAPVQTATTGNTQSWADPKSSDYVGRREVARRQAAAATARPTAAQTNPGYKSVSMGPVTYSGLAGQKPAATAKPVTATAPAVTTVRQPTEKQRDEYQRAIQQRVTNEGLSWSKSFDPGMLVWKRMHESK